MLWECIRVSSGVSAKVKLGKGKRIYAKLFKDKYACARVAVCILRPNFRSPEK